ncbi:UNVERIFIED_CONTAM: Ankyrin repeat protein SKIP35 [Sesamum angustifolium]|uniref:Ankyrin repeat protein SKIP35 n=1 Tax=Sesamum angustifolium TaxID=2727405 RepID=A0AAW2PSK0_9LAMI
METKKVFFLGRETETNSELGSQDLNIGGDSNMEEPQCAEVEMVEMETAEAGVSSLSNEIERGTEIAGFCSEKSDGGCHGNVIFSREAPLVIKEDLSTSACSCGAEKLKSKLAASDSENGKSDRKLSRQDRIELGRLFQGAVCSHDWELAESLIFLADPQTLNDALCISLDSIWFLSTQQEFYGITGIINKIIAHGAYDFTRAALRTSFLASCVSACQSQTMSLADTVTMMSQRLSERLQECSGDEVLKAEAGAKSGHKSALEIQLQLSAFKTFLDLVGNHLTGKDFSEAFDAACFPLTLFSSTFDNGWSSGISATAIQGLLGMLVEGGADNVNQCFLEASRFGSTELVRILLQIAQRNSLDVDVDLALGFASHYGKIGTMECLVEEGNAGASWGL